MDTNQPLRLGAGLGLYVGKDVEMNKKRIRRTLAIIAEFYTLKA